MQKHRPDDNDERDKMAVEKNIVVQMQPLSQRKVKIKVKRHGRAKPIIVLDTLPKN